MWNSSRVRGDRPCGRSTGTGGGMPSGRRRAADLRDTNTPQGRRVADDPLARRAASWAPARRRLARIFHPTGSDDKCFVMVVTTSLRHNVDGDSEGVLGDLAPFQYVATARKNYHFGHQGRQVRTPNAQSATCSRAGQYMQVDRTSICTNYGKYAGTLLNSSLRAIGVLMPVSR